MNPSLIAALAALVTSAGTVTATIRGRVRRRVEVESLATETSERVMARMSTEMDRLNTAVATLRAEHTVCVERLRVVEAALRARR